MPPSPIPPIPQTLAQSIVVAAGVGAHCEAGQGWAALDAASASLACGLLGLKLQRGDRIGIVGEQLAEWPLLFCAAARIGVAVLALRPPPCDADPDAEPAADLEAQLAHSAAKVVFTPQRHRGVDLIAALARLVPRLPALRHVIATDGGGLNSLAALAATPLEPGPLSVAQRRVLADDIAMLVYPSDGTDRPAATALSHRSLLAGAAAAPQAEIALPRPILLRASLPATAAAAASRSHQAAHQAAQRARQR